MARKHQPATGTRIGYEKTSRTQKQLWLKNDDTNLEVLGSFGVIAQEQFYMVIQVLCCIYCRLRERILLAHCHKIQLFIHYWQEDACVCATVYSAGAHHPYVTHGVSYSTKWVDIFSNHPSNTYLILTNSLTDVRYELSEQIQWTLSVG